MVLFIHILARIAGIMYNGSTMPVDEYRALYRKDAE